MSNEQAIADHWATGDVYARIVAALAQTLTSLDALTVQDLAPVDHFHALGLPATVELGDRLPIQARHHILDIGCGLGGPARYFAQRFHCKVVVEETGAKYLAAYRQAPDMTARGALPPLGLHILTGETAPQKTRNAARNIAEDRTYPVQVVCRKPT